MRHADFRSDTVTRPNEAMRRAMAAAEVGDDVYGDDPTVNRLEKLGAELLGTEAALFASSGTQTNLLALLTHCGRGDEYIVGQDAHTYKYEGGGAAALGSIVPQPIELEADGSLDLAKVAAKIKPDDFHHARSRLLCLENTQGGKVLGLDYQREAAAFAKGHGLAIHLDGARIFNAAVKLGVSASTIAGHYDTISVCLSKGLGAPVGSLLCGRATFIKEARRWRKVLGGGMRQAGIIAAGAIYALQHNIERLAEDHANAAYLATSLAGIPGLEVLPHSGETNMVFVRFATAKPHELAAALEKKGILVTPGNPMRLVTHLDIARDDAAALVEGIRSQLTK
ncbi:MAG TPA: low-specificity L-threonine aldolase [Rectinemataceae bacterium]|nr:low-specificity L-threonine aldolase [Rectinemataceae bacterium]